MIAYVTAALCLLIVVIAVEAARLNRARGLLRIGLANAALAGAAAALGGAAFLPCVSLPDAAAGLAAAVLVRVLVDRRICPAHLSICRLIGPPKVH